MKPIHILDRDICCGRTDLTIIPCSGKMKTVEKPRNQARIDNYGLPTPNDLKNQFSYGKISPIFAPTKNVEDIRFFAFAASVFNKSDPSALESIGKQLGQLTKERSDIRLIEAPFLGCGDGGLTPSIAIFALAKGFLQSHHPDATLQLCSDSAVSVRLGENTLDDLYLTMKKSDTKPDISSLYSDNNFEYDVALSFAGEQRPFMESLSYMLKAHGVRVFLDTDESASLWGENLVDELFNIYANRSRYCVILVSKDYNEKEWTNLERQAAQDRAFREKGRGYILPIRFDKTELRSLPSTVAYLNASLGVEKIYELLLQKLKRS